MWDQDAQSGDRTSQSPRPLRVRSKTAPARLFWAGPVGTNQSGATLVPLHVAPPPGEYFICSLGVEGVRDEAMPFKNSVGLDKGDFLKDSQSGPVQERAARKERQEKFTSSKSTRKWGTPQSNSSWLASWFILEV